MVPQIAKHFLFGPGQRCLSDAVLGSIHPRRFGVQDGVELHGVQVPPLTRLGVIVDGAGFATFGTAKWCSLKMFDIHANLLGRGIKFYIGHEPGSLESENLLVEFGFLDRCSPLRRILTDPQYSRMDLISWTLIGIIRSSRFG